MSHSSTSPRNRLLRLLTVAGACVTLTACSYSCTPMGLHELNAIRPDVETRLTGVTFDSVYEYDCDSGAEASLGYTLDATFDQQAFSDKLEASGCARRPDESGAGAVNYTCDGNPRPYLISYRPGDRNVTVYLD